MFLRSRVIHNTLVAPPSGIITTNIVGGLGNQLFLVANLLATASRNNLVPFVEREAWSSSCNEPRPTYWKTQLLGNAGIEAALASSRDEAERIVLMQQHQQQQQQEGNDINPSRIMSSSNKDPTVIPELGPDAKPIVIDRKKTDGHKQQQEAGNGRDVFNLVGFFQSDRYFSDFQSDITRLFRPPELADAAGRVLKNNNNSSRSSPQQQHTVALHVRRGDYLQLKDTFEILDHSYYTRALEQLFGPLLVSRYFSLSSSSSSKHQQSHQHFGSQYGNAPLFRVLIFSDDTEYAKLLCGAISVKYPCVDARVVVSSFDENSNNQNCISFPEIESSPQQKHKVVPQDVKELLLMSCCDDVVIANSSFSWWGAYLNVDVPFRRVVAPQRWFVGREFPGDMVHVYPADWIVL